MHEAEGSPGLEIMPAGQSAISGAIAAVKAELVSGCESILASLCSKAERVVRDLAAVAGGGKEPESSWKAKLTEASTWDDVLREAAYFLFPKGVPITKRLDELHVQVKKEWPEIERAKAALEAVTKSVAPEPSTALIERKDAATALSKITGMEAHLMEALDSGSQRSRKLKGLVITMTKHNIAPEDLDARIWAKDKSFLGKGPTDA